MTEPVVSASAAPGTLEERVTQLAREKSFLQLIINLTNKIISVSGLDNITDNILQGVLNVIGGTFLALYYRIDGDLYYADITGQKALLPQCDDENILKVLETGVPVELELAFAETQMTTSAFGKACTWIYPLKIGAEIVGVLKLENLHFSMADVSSHLQTLFSYIAMTLRNEVLGQTRLKRAYDELATEVAERRKAQDELGRSNELLEARVEKRTAALRQANEALRESHDAYRCILETTTAGFLHTDASGRILAANDSYLRLSGYSREELLTLSSADIDIMETPEQGVEHLKRIKAAGGDHFETKHRRKDGTVWDAEITCSYLDTKGGQIFAFQRDITSRKRSEEMIVTANKLLQTIINTAPVRVFWKDTDLRYLGANRLFAHDAGFDDPERLIGMDDYHLSWRDHADRYRADDRQVIDSGVPRLSYDEPLATGNGEHLWLRTSKVPLRDENDTVFGVLGVYEDITEYKRYEESLREANEKFSAAFNNAPIMISITDISDGTFLDINQQFLSVSGFRREEVIGRSSVDIGWINATDRNRLKDRLMELGKIDDVELTVYTKSGKEVLCKYWAELIRVAGRQRVLSIALDITEHRRMEEQFIQAQKMESVGRLAGGVAHDFNNMLGVILGHTELALMHADPANPLLKHLEEIFDAANRSAEITRQLLAFARKQVAEPRVIDLNETVPGMLKILRRLIGEDIELVWNPGYELKKIRIDPAQLDQILANLCVNARDAIAGIGKIDIQTENIRLDDGFPDELDAGNVTDYVLLSVTDSGSGMEKDVVEHIFEPFYTTKGIGQGTGLGLATVFGIVKQNGGQVRVYSEPGEGTVFRIYFPACRGEHDGASAAKAVLNRGHETILLVEDEVAVMNLGIAMLSALGYQVLPANSPEEAQQLSEQHRGGIDLLMTDIIMPGMNGRDLASRLDQINPGMKQLFMSGYTAEIMTDRGKIDNAVHFLQKPFTIQKLSEKVREALDS